MTLPGKQTTISSEAPSRLNALDTAAWHVVGKTAQGPLGPIPVRSIAEFVRVFGTRVAATARLYDDLDAFFAGGGGIAYVSREVGPDAETATGVLDDDSADDALIVDAVGPGAWANGIVVDVDYISGSDTFSLTVTYEDEVVEESPALSTIDEAVSWAQASAYIRLTDGEHDLPADGETVTLAGGDDDHANITSTEVGEALDRFTELHGPGQISVPGDTSAAVHALLLAKGESRNRCPVLDLIDSNSDSGLAAEVSGLRDDVGARFASAFAPRVAISGIAPGTTRTVSASAIVAAAIARSEAAGNSPNVAAAGVNGIVEQAQGLSQVPWTEDEREVLNDAGVNVIRQLENGSIRIYGWRSLVDPQVDDLWVQWSGARLVMAIRAQWNEIAERYLFAQFDGRGFKLADFEDELKAVCARYYNDGALFGETPADAFFIDTGPSVNPVEQVAAGLIKARGEVRVSPFGERIEIEIVRRRAA